MPIPVKCQTCGYAAHAADSESGKIARCPKCTHLLKVDDIHWSPPDFGKIEPPPFVEALVEASPPPAEPFKPKPKPDPKPKAPPKPIDLADVFFKLEECRIVLKQLAWYLMLITLFTAVSCVDSCERMSGVQRIKVELTDRGW